MPNTDVKTSQSYQLKNRSAWREQQVVDILYHNGSGAIFGNLINISLVTYILREVYPGSALLMWFGFGITLNLVRFYTALIAFKRNRNWLVTSQWLTLYRCLTLISGAHFGILGVFFFDAEDSLYQALVIFVVGGSGAAAVGTHGADLTTYRLFILPSVIPMATRSFIEGTAVHNALAIMLLLLVIILLRAASQTRNVMRENIDMSYSLKYRATHDVLVPLLNRDEFKKRFEQLQAQPAGNQLTAMIFIDLDNFKALNDTFGHQAGDQALLEVSDVIRASIRQHDLAARFGGDEFIILIRANEIDNALVVGEKILMAISQFSENGEHSLKKLGASIGIAYTDNANVGFEELLKHADQACYTAKRRKDGRAEVVKLEN